MSLFDTGRPTGAMGGAVAADQQRRADRTDDLTFQTKQAEFHDWLNAAEYRQESRKTGVAQAKAERAELPSRTTKNIEENVTATEQTQASRDLIGAQKVKMLNDIHMQMSDQRYNQVTRAYYLFDEGVKAGRDPKEMYALAYKQLLNTGDPEGARRFLERMNIGPEADERSINAMAALSTYGLTDAPTSRQAWLLNKEWEHKRRLALIEAQTTDPNDLRIRFPDANEIKNIGNMLAGYITDFNDFQGGTDDAGNYTGERGKIVSTIANWSTLAQKNQILGDKGVSPIHYQQIGADIINYAKQDLSEEGWFWGTANTGDTFNGAPFMNAANAAMGILEVERMKVMASNDPKYGNPPDMYALWKDKSMQIMGLLKQTNWSTYRAGFTPPGNRDSGQAGTDGTQAGSATQTVDQSSQQTQQPPATPAKKLTRRQEINKEISGMSSSDKFRFTDQGKVKTERYQRLLDERKALQNDTQYFGAAG